MLSHLFRSFLCEVLVESKSKEFWREQLTKELGQSDQSISRPYPVWLGCYGRNHRVIAPGVAGLQPYLETYTCMIILHYEAHGLDDAQEIMQMMILGGVCPSMNTYHAFVKIEDFKGIFKLIELMKEDDNRCIR
ncbi:hypothetical protein M5K25_000472 [Dendrobium thyrsiflorum]|uniref:Pentatricopeptide repeat-containing protein n=1 Tax=Dendrobium thyrsiflorum TaxID=117978 RepID=A0ABD0VU08_DENTH